jgi:hypothetical protein
MGVTRQRGCWATRPTSMRRGGRSDRASPSSNRAHLSSASHSGPDGWADRQDLVAETRCRAPENTPDLSLIDQLGVGFDQPSSLDDEMEIVAKALAQAS